MCFSVNRISGGELLSGIQLRLKPKADESQPSIGPDDEAFPPQSPRSLLFAESHAEMTVVEANAGVKSTININLLAIQTLFRH